MVSHHPILRASQQGGVVVHEWFQTTVHLEHLDVRRGLCATAPSFTRCTWNLNPYLLQLLRPHHALDRRTPDRASGETLPALSITAQVHTVRHH